MTDLQDWIAVLEQAAGDNDKEIEQVVNKGALNIKQSWRDRWTGHHYIPYLPWAVTYDLHRDGVYSTAQIGPDKELPQGPLGNIIEFGTINNAPIPGGLPALAEEEPRFVDAIAELGESLLAGERR